MNDEENKGYKYKKTLQYFFQGLLIIAPIVITFYALFFVISSIDGLIPIFSTTDEYGNVHVQNYGLGIVVIVVAILMIGYFSSFFITLLLIILWSVIGSESGRSWVRIGSELG